MSSQAYSVYQHVAPNGKCYVGISGRPVKRRWKNGSSYRANKHFFSAIEKYGWDSFTHEVLASGLTKEEACDMEVRLIAEKNSNDPAFGYNKSRGGDKTTLGYAMSDATKAKISAAKKGKPNPFTEEHRRRIGEALKGHEVSDSTREKLRLALGDRFKTESAIENHKKNTPRGGQHFKATAVKCVETGEVFCTIAQACEKYSVDRNGIARCLTGAQKTAGGKHWAKHINNEEEPK